jgi:hypothetical protein
LKTEIAEQKRLVEKRVGRRVNKWAELRLAERRRNNWAGHIVSERLCKQFGIERKEENPDLIRSGEIEKKMMGEEMVSISRAFASIH